MDTTNNDKDDGDNNRDEETSRLKEPPTKPNGKSSQTASPGAADVTESSTANKSPFQPSSMRITMPLSWPCLFVCGWGNAVCRGM